MKRLFEILKDASFTGAIQLIIQGCSVLAGIAIVRFMTKQEYAWYTITNAVLGIVGVLSDGGIVAGVMAKGGEVWNNKEKLGSVVVTGLSLRKKFTLTSLIVAIPILAVLLHRHGATFGSIMLIFCCLIPVVLATISDSLLETVPKLQLNLGLLQKNQLTVSISRLILTTIVLIINPTTYMVLAVTGITRIIGNVNLKHIASRYVFWGALPDDNVKQDILDIIKRSLPSAIYYSFSSQITLGILSFVGKTEGIADMGALGRITFLTNIGVSFFSLFIVPRFSRLKDSKEELLSFIIKSLFILFIGILLFLTVTWYFAEYLLSLFGSEYLNLKYELYLSVLSGCISMTSSCLYNLCSARGWIVHPFLLITTNVLSIILGLFLFDVSVLYKVLLFNIFTSIPSLLLLLYHPFNEVRQFQITK